MAAGNDTSSAIKRSVGVQPIAFSSAVVTGLTYVMQGGPPHQPVSSQSFNLTKDPTTGQIYLDNFGTMCMTPGWPHTLPMAGQVGEIMDFKTPFACIRWTRQAGDTLYKYWLLCACACPPCPVVRVLRFDPLRPRQHDAR